MIIFVSITYFCISYYSRICQRPAELVFARAGDRAHGVARQLYRAAMPGVARPRELCVHQARVVWSDGGGNHSHPMRANMLQLL